MMATATPRPLESQTKAFQPNEAKPFNIFVVGRTGDGKSTLCNFLYRTISGGHEGSFKESDSAHSSVHKHDVMFQTFRGVTIHDTPGLMDTQGTVQDEDNIKTIVNYARRIGNINAIFLVFNEKAPRFDAGMQDAVKLLFDSFGPKCLNFMAIVYTKADGLRTTEEAKKHSDQVCSLVAERTGMPRDSVNFPRFQVECHLEQLEEMMKESVYKRLCERNFIQVNDALRWADTNQRLDTSDVHAGEYDHRKREREAAEKKKELELAIANEQTRREAAERAKAEAERKAADQERLRTEDNKNLTKMDSMLDALTKLALAKSAPAAPTAPQFIPIPLFGPGQMGGGAMPMMSPFGPMMPPDFGGGIPGGMGMSDMIPLSGRRPHPGAPPSVSTPPSAQPEYRTVRGESRLVHTVPTSGRKYTINHSGTRSYLK